MLNLIIKKWVEPYKLLELIKEHSAMEDFSFDGSNKAILKAHFLKQLKNEKELRTTPTNLRILIRYRRLIDQPHI